MSQGKMFVEALLNWKAPTAPAPVAVPADVAVRRADIFKKQCGDFDIEAAIYDKDRYSCVIAELKISAAVQRIPSERFSELVERFVERVDYLPERLALVELDRQSGSAQIRSKQPLLTENAREFFEIRLTDRHDFSLRRFRKPDGEAARQPREMVITFDICERLIDDIAALWQAE